METLCIELPPEVIKQQADDATGCQNVWLINKFCVAKMLCEIWEINEKKANWQQSIYILSLSIYSSITVQGIYSLSPSVAAILPLQSISCYILSCDDRVPRPCCMLITRKLDTINDDDWETVREREEEIWARLQLLVNIAKCIRWALGSLY